jgi:hypothetical protein
MSPAGLWLVILGAVAGEPPPPPETRNLDLEAKLESLVGTNISVGAPVNSVSALLGLTPGADLVDRWQTGNFSLRYAPLLYLFVPSGEGYPSNVLVLNRVSYEAATQLNRTANLSLNGALWFGEQNYSPVVNFGTPPGAGAGLPPGATLPPGQLPQVQLLRIISSFTQLTFSFSSSPTAQFAFAGGYIYTEGANAASRLQLPLQQGPFVLARSDVLLNERDTLTPALRMALLRYGPIFWAAGSTTESGSTVTVPHFQEGLELVSTELTLRWGHQETRLLRTELAAGLGVFNQSASQDVLSGQSGDLVGFGRAFLVPADTSVDPIVRARLVAGFLSEAQPLELTLYAGLAPLVNQFSGTVYERVEGTVSADWTLSPFVRVGVTGGVADSFTPQELDVRGEVRAVWSPVTSVAVAVGARGAWVDYSTPGALNGFNWTVFLSVTGATRGLF